MVPAGLPTDARGGARGRGRLNRPVNLQERSGAVAANFGAHFAASPRDQVVQLETDNVVSDGAEGLSALGIEPTGIEAIAPSYLWRYRRGGQFSERPATA